MLAFKLLKLIAESLFTNPIDR